MALVDSAWYVNYGDGSTTGYYAVTKWATGATIAAGALRRQNAAPSVGNERVFVAVVAGTTHASTEPTWTVTRGAKNTDNTVTWQECTGIAALNGDATNTANWTTVKNTSVTLGQVIKRNNGASYQICTTAGTAGNSSEPAFSDTAGTTTADNTVTWTSLGVVGNFTGWQAPHARLVNAFASTWGQNGNNFFLGDNHAETQASLMQINGGTQALPMYCYSVDHTIAPATASTLLAGASITTTGNSRIMVCNASNNSQYYKGITFNAGSGANGVNSSFLGAVSGNLSLDDCTISIPTTTASTLEIGGSQAANRGSACRVLFNNTVLSFGLAGHTIMVGIQNFKWRNTASAIGGTVPTTLFESSSASDTLGGGVIELDGLDLSAAGSGKTLFGNAVAGYVVNAVNCKLGASVTVAAPPVSRGAYVKLVGCNTTTNVERNELYEYEGTLTTETTIIRTAGASDGTTAYSWKVVTTANANRAFPFETFEGAVWNSTTGSSKTLTIHTVTDNVTLQDADIWVEVEYLGSSGTPVASLISSAPATQLTTGSNLTSDSGEAWTTTGLGTPVKQSMSVTFTPQMAGPIRWKVKVAKASATVYVCPKADVA